MKQRNRYYYPVVLKNKKLRAFKISPDIELRRITQREREEFFGIKKVDFIFTSGKFPLGHVAFLQFIISKKKGRCHYEDLSERGIFDGSSDILAANYVLIIESSDRADALIEKLNISFKLLRPTSTGGYIGFKDKEIDVSYHYNMAIHGPFDYLSLSNSDLEQIKRIFLLTEKYKADEKFKLCSDLYCRALQGNNIRFDLRFLLLVMCLDSLYGPKEDKGEATFKFSLRGASLLSKFGCGNKEQLFRDLKEIYKIRSSLVHTGKAKLIKENFLKATQYARISLIRYLEDRDLFSEKMLNSIIF